MREKLTLEPSANGTMIGDRILSGPTFRTIKDPKNPNRKIRVGDEGDLYREFGIPYSREHLWRMAREGTFPAPLKLSGNTNRYLQSEIVAWLRSRPRAVKPRIVKRSARRRVAK